MSGSDPTKPTDQDRKDKDSAPREKTTGRVAFDSRGNAVWEWKMKTGVFGRDVDTGKLRTLEAKELEIAADPAPPASPERQQQQQRKAKVAGFDPYNSNAPGLRPPPASRPAAGPEEKPQKRGFLRRLFGRG